MNKFILFSLSESWGCTNFSLGNTSANSIVGLVEGKSEYGTGHTEKSLKRGQKQGDLLARATKLPNRNSGIPYRVA